MTFDIDNPFAGMQNTVQSNKGNYLPPNHLFKLKVKECKMVPSEQKGTTYFVVEFTVVESSSDDHRPGMTVSWSADVGSSNPMKARLALADSRAFMAAAMQCPVSKMTDALGKKIVDSEKQVAAGQIVTCETIGVTTKANRQFTKHVFTAVEES